MKPIKQKKRRYYALVFVVVLAIVGGLYGYNKYKSMQREKAYNDAVSLMEQGLKMDDFPSLNAAEMAIREEAKRPNPRVETVAYDIILRSWIWFAYTGEEVLMSDCRKYLAFLKEPLVDDTGNEFESPYKDDPMTAVADNVYNAVYDKQEEAIVFFNKMEDGLLLAGEKEFWMAVAHWRLGQWPPAEANMRRAVQADDTPHHRFGLARVLDLSGKVEEAKVEYGKVVQANPNHHAAEAYLLLLTMPEDKDAVEVIDGFFKKYEGQVESRVASDLTIAMADALWLKGDQDKALSAIRQAKTADPWYATLRDWEPPKPPAPLEGEEGAEGQDGKKSS